TEMYRTQPAHKDEVRPAAPLAPCADPDGDRRVGGVRVAPDDARVDQTDERDEEPDADADRDLETGRHRGEDRGPEAGEDQPEDDEALDDDQAHGVGPAHLRR